MWQGQPPIAAAVSAVLLFEPVDNSILARSSGWGFVRVGDDTPGILISVDSRFGTAE